ncbi:MAG: right-handed parallel beta-helix repeat-containing protein, partial [candidate division WOR-3 bacterium]
MYKFIILLTIFSVGFGVFYQQDYQGYHKITGAITQQQIERRLFCHPQGFVYVLGLGGNRVAFCVDEGWHRVVYAKEGGDWVKAWGNYSSGNDGFKCPVGVCSDYYRNIYVADAGNGRIVKLVYNPDIEELQYATEFPIGGSGSVWDIDFYDYKFYVTDPLNHHIYKLDSSGTILVTYGIKGRGIGQFWGPKGIAVFGGNVYIADEWNKRVVWLTDRGDHFEWKDVRYLTEWDYPRIHDVEVDNDGFVYVIDFNNGHILKFAPDLSQLLLVFGSEGYGSNQFYHPSFMHIRGNDVVVVEEWGDSSGIQYYGIKTGISEAKVMIDNFDATERNTNFYFKLDGQASIDVGIRDSLGHKVITLIKDSLMSYGAHYVEWNGRDTTGKVVLPGKYICDIYATSGSDVDDVHLVFRVKGTIKSGVLSSNEHWTEEGEPYVLVGDVQVAGGGRLTIDPGVKVMPTGNYGILPRYQYPYWHHIYAQGTVLNKILFTPHRKLYPTPDSIPKGFWRGIDFHTASWEDSLIFTNCIIEGAGSDSAAFWAYLTKYVELTSCEIAKSGGFGFYCDYRCNTIQVNNCQFIDNDSIPLVVPFRFIGEVYGNSFVNNKLNVIGITAGGPSNPRDTDAFVHNQGVPYWVLKGHGWECMMRSSNYNYCPTLTVEPG